MATSKLAIWKAAVLEVGGSQPQSLTDTGVEALTCESKYDIAKRAVLRMHPWNCAIRRASVGYDSGVTPAFGYTYCVTLPGDCLRTLRPFQSGGVDIKDGVKKEGNKLYSNHQSLQFRYISNISESEMHDDLLVETLAAYLAWKIGPKVADKPKYTNDAFNSFRYHLSKAKGADALEDDPDEVDADHLLDAFQGMGDV